MTFGRQATIDTLHLQLEADRLQFVIGQVLDADELIARALVAANQLIELRLHCGGVAVL